MAGKNKPLQHRGPPKAEDKNFPGLTPAQGPAPAPKTTQYEELQQNELIALEAIYGEDFRRVDGGQNVWKKSEPSFEIRIRALDEEFTCSIRVVITATYPKSPPLISLTSGDLRPATAFKIEKFLQTKPRALAAEEQEMMHQIVEGIRDILEDAAQAKANGNEVSLEEERARHEQVLAQQARKQQEEEERKRAEASKAEEQEMQGQIEEELKRQHVVAKETRRTRTRPSEMDPPSIVPEPESGDNVVVFEQPCKTIDRVGNTIHFKAVCAKSEYSTSRVCVVYQVQPLLNSQSNAPTLALKEATLKCSNTRDSARFKKQVNVLESHLQTLKSAAHDAHLVELLDYKIERGPDEDDGNGSNSWTVAILTPFANFSSLREFLDISGRVQVSKVRAWTRDLLQGLEWLHNRGFYHGDIHPGNVLLFRDGTGDIVAKLTDAVYQRELHNMIIGSQALPGLQTPKSAYWLPPEISGAAKPHYNQKTDIWEMGLLVLHMLFGVDALNSYSSPADLMTFENLSRELKEFLTLFFAAEPKGRPRAFELGSNEFLATDAPIFALDGGDIMLSSLHSQPAFSRPLRRESVVARGSGRFKDEFTEDGRLGKGGFGEVVKARKKLDGGTFAIKKIKLRSTSTLSELLKEVRVLSSLSHPQVVRYFDAWVEEDADASDSEDLDDTSMSEETPSGAQVADSPSQGTVSQEDPLHFPESTGGIDYLSSTGYPKIIFAHSGEDEEEEEDESDDGVGDHDDDDETEEDADDDADESDEDDETSSENEAVPAVGSPENARNLVKSRLPASSPRILYISMEYCEKRNLKDLISRNLYKHAQEVWRLFRQIVDGLRHIHSKNIVHRDLKPENVFISQGLDGEDNVKIGDFGLATIGQFVLDKTASAALDHDNVTKSIGTMSYAAPEIRSSVRGAYSAKVDMYSLGIIFFEMCSSPPSSMHERMEVLQRLRQPDPVLPADFKPADKIQTELVLSLVRHNPKERPSSEELFHRLINPMAHAAEKVLATAFAQPVEKARDFAWDMSSSAWNNGNEKSAEDLAFESYIRETLTKIFRRHGGLEMNRSQLYPLSRHYGSNVVKLMHPDGTVLQLPYDLIIGLARMLAKKPNIPIQKCYTFGTVFRDDKGAGQPRTIDEVDFDIITKDTLDMALKEAEVLKVLDEIVCTLLASHKMCFHVGHSDLLQLIFDFCSIPHAIRNKTAEVLSKLNLRSFTWLKVRAELRSDAIGVSTTSVDELQRFDFRETPNKAFAKIKGILEGSQYQLAMPTIAHLKEVVEYCKRLGVVNTIYINPLNSFRESLYSGGIHFSCIYNNKIRDIFAAGGRYDSLIKELRQTGSQIEERHAVGFSLSLENFSRQHKQRGKSHAKKADDDERKAVKNRTCDVLVASTDAGLLRSAGIEVLQQLWAHDISAELAPDSRSSQGLMSRNRNDQYCWTILVKADHMLKIRTHWCADVPDADVPDTRLLVWLRSELRDRDQRTSVKLRTVLGADPHTQELYSGGGGGGGGPSSAGPSGGGGGGGGPFVMGQSSDRSSRRVLEVSVLVAQTKSKKFNRQALVDQARASAEQLVDSFLADGRILAVEGSDGLLTRLEATAMSDPESWRALEQSVGTTNERDYARDLQERLRSWHADSVHHGATRHVFVYNFRTGKIIYYDLGV